MKISIRKAITATALSAVATVALGALAAPASAGVLDGTFKRINKVSTAVTGTTTAAATGSITTTSIPAGTSTVLPTVAYTGATCVKTTATSWTVTMRWTARNGRYTDVGSASAGFTSGVKVLPTQTRTFIKKVTVSNFGGTATAPNSVNGRYSQVVAPYLWNGSGTSTSTLTGTYVTAPVTCPK